VRELMDLVLERFAGQDDEAGPDQGPRRVPRIAVVGRPNAGKSTLVNAIIGEERVIAFGEPGTTRDSIYIDFERGGKSYTLIDTAGLRRRARVGEVAEKFSVIKTLQSIEDANVVILVLDAQQDISEQDAHIAGFILEAGRAVVVAVNKWDGLDRARREHTRRELGRKLAFLSFAQVHYVSAREGKGLAELIKSVDLAYAAAMVKLPTPKLTRALIAATTRQAPPRHGRFRPKLRYAHQGGMNPPIIVIHGNQLDSLPDSYRRYLERFFIDAFRLRGTPVRIQLKVGANPYAGRH
jgi:GTP-binding protein